MIRMYFYMLILLPVVLMSGCVTKTYLSKESLDVLKPGMSSVDVESRLQKKPDFVTSVDFEQNAYITKFYRMQTGVRQDTSMMCGQYGCMPIFVSVPVIDPFIFIYRDNQLSAWGLVDDLLKLQNSRKSEISRVSFNQYKDYLIKKQKDQQLADDKEAEEE